MALIIAEQLFGYKPPVPDRVWLDALSIFNTERRAQGKTEISSAQRRRKRSLALLHLNPDMAAVIVMRAVRKHLEEEYHVFYDGRVNKFKEWYDEYTTSKMLGFMETVTAVFRRRHVEMDLMLKSHGKKEIKAGHAIRDKGFFDPDAYEMGREEAFKLMVLALPQRNFSLLEGLELAEDSPAP